MDGENTTLYTDSMHARSIDSGFHASRSYVKQMQATIGYNIPEGWMVCGENMYAQHSIKYENLKSYFYVFSIWDDTNTCLSWDDTEEWCSLLELVTVPVLYRGKWDQERLIELAKLDSFDHEAEGYVVRLASSFGYNNFSKSIAKFVRKGHVQTDQHWTEKEVVPNKLGS